MTGMLALALLAGCGTDEAQPPGRFVFVDGGAHKCESIAAF